MVDPQRVDERTTVGVFLRQVARRGDGTLVRYHDGEGWREVSWNRMRDLVLRVAARLVGQGVQPGERVAIMSGNSLEWLYCDLGIQAAGCVSVPIYPSTIGHVARGIAENAGARVAFVANEELAGRLQLDGVVRMDTELREWVGAEPDAELLAEVESRAAGIRPDDLVTLVYTSGTTGPPKGVMLAHRCFVDVARSCLQVFDIGEDDESLSFLPYAHVFERINGLFVCIAAGCSVWISRGVDRMLEDLQECRPTVMVSVPRVYEKMHQRVTAAVRQAPGHRRALFHWAVAEGRRRSRGQFAPFFPLADRLVLASLRQRLTGGRLRFFVSGGAPLSTAVEDFFWALGIKILQGWGMTETSSGATSNTERRHRFETVGPPLPGVEVKIAEDGEILLKSPGNMLGYFHNEEATAEVLQDGWVRTGDIGDLTPDGFLRITDRKKDMIKTAGGKFVAPQPLEARLQQAPAIERAVLIGDERPYVVALVVPDWEALQQEAGVSGSAEELLEDDRPRAVVQRCVDDVNRELSGWETIKYFRLLPHDFSEENGELTPTLKVKRRVVQDRYRTLIDGMYEGMTPAGPAGR